ncbi:MAG: hypothetical protein I8H75_02625 [Myxococcaceae bacterium]|nr:hypothetical protein [Myxococcaceae bacterium]MBH2006231.1 hypothetical protein [Myxococcaceae bacterium]
MKILLIDDNLNDFPMYLEKVAFLRSPLELLYTNTVESALKQIEKGGVHLVFLGKSFQKKSSLLREQHPHLDVVGIKGPNDRAFSMLKTLSCKVKIT